MGPIAPSFVPAVSLQVLSDGSLRPYLPNAIQFRDRGLSAAGGAVFRALGDAEQTASA